jgi:hypothetical protein
MSNNRYDYASASDPRTPLFTVTPGKNCRLYPYIWTKDCATIYGGPDKNPYLCRPQAPVDPGQQYTGLPVFFEYNLAGEKCDKKDQSYTPRVL